ncbi:unnamed protein product [Durusdinium trenchii]|uniref:Uncharacterized protein n=1 Tax=Durusdinium trenchii TaxID=1381693 RepID=A0ABP0SVX0_9DINO
MAVSLRWARRRARNTAILAQSAHVEDVMTHRTHRTQRWNIDSPNATKQGGAKPGGIPFSGDALAALAAPASLNVKTTVKAADLQVLCRRLRKLPLRQLGPSLPALHAQIHSLSETASAHFWSSISRRILVNAAERAHFPLRTLAFALPELQRLGLLKKVSALGKLVRGLARQASQADHADLLPLLNCCRTLQLQLSISKPRAQGCWAGRLHKKLTRSLPPVLAEAPPGIVIPWMEYYAEHGMVHHEHLHVWERAAESLKSSLLSYEDEERLLKFQDRAPLWVVECLPEVASKSDAITTCLTSDSDLELVEAPPDVESQQDLTLANLQVTPTSPPMYLTSPPVPVLWHMLPVNYERSLSRLGGRQLVLALRYAAADGAGASIGQDLRLTEGNRPRKHRSRSRAQAFIAALLWQLSRTRITPSDACSVVKSLASLQKVGLADCLEAAETLEALVAGPLSGWKVATVLTPSDVAVLLQGMASLVGSLPDESIQPLQVVARTSMESSEGSVARLLELAACALQEAGAPPKTLRAMCGAAASLAKWRKKTRTTRRTKDEDIESVSRNAEGEGNHREWQETKTALERFLRAAAVAARDGPHPQAPQLKQPLAVLRAAGDCGIWSSEVFAMLAPMVTELILGRPLPRLPGYARDWKPLLPRSGYIRSVWQIEELAEVAWLYGSHRRPLEGQTGVALSLTLLVQMPVLNAGLAAPSSRHLDSTTPSRSDLLGSDLDSRILAFACDSCRVLRKVAEEPYFVGIWRPPNGQQAVEEFDPQFVKDHALAMQVLRKWKRQVDTLLFGSSCGARVRSRKLRESKDGWLGRDVLAACSALSAFERQSDEALALTASAKTCLLRAYLRQNLQQESKGQLRAWLRHERMLKRAKDAFKSMPTDHYRAGTAKQKHIVLFSKDSF